MYGFWAVLVWNWVITRFLLLQGGVVNVAVIDSKYRRSSLVQAGLEILIKVIQSREQVPFGGEIVSSRKDWAHDFRHLVSGLFVWLLRFEGLEEGLDSLE